MKAYVLLCLLLLASNADAKVFQFLYIEASEGNSSGGHVAVRLGDEIYHYQYENTLIRLFKHNAEAFRVNYQLLQNRSIHVADIEVSDSAYEQIGGYFKVKLFEQKQRLKHLQALQRDQSLLQALLEWKTGKPVTFPAPPELSPQLPGAGLFYSGDDAGLKKPAGRCDTVPASAKIISGVRRQLEIRYGKNFLSQKILSTRKELNQLSPLTDINDFSSSLYSFSERYSDLLNGWLVLQVLQTYRPLAGTACFQINLPEMRLDDAQIKQAEAFRQSLVQTVQSLMVSKRPDWGYALFVTLARLIVTEQSLQTHHWTFLDDTDENTPSIPHRQLALYAAHLKKQRHADVKRLQEAVSGFTVNSRAYEHNYVNLEVAANRYQQWLESDKTGQFRYQSEQPLPGKSIPLTRFLSTGLSPGQIEIALHRQGIAAERLIKEDNGRNAYHLLTNNCVTALFELINEAVAGQSEQMLGGFIDPEINFIPFQAFDSVQEAYNVVKIKELPAYRRQELTRMYDQEADSWVYARESNVFSSSLYNHNPDDAWFVFFTDDAMLLRPVFGAVNTLAATAQSLLGAISWPFDEGREIKIGVRGVLASLPELAFFNIRKGSYPYAIEP